jgi:hypothetical protein
VLNIEDGANIGAAIAGETLVSPAQRVRRQNDIVELQNRVARIGRLLLEHVEPGPCDTPFLEHFSQRLLIDDRPARCGVIARLPPQRYPHCRKWICNEQWRE